MVLVMFRICWRYWVVQHSHLGCSNPQHKTKPSFTFSIVGEAILKRCLLAVLGVVWNGELEEVVGELLRDKLQLGSSWCHWRWWGWGDPTNGDFVLVYCCFWHIKRFRNRNRQAFTVLLSLFIWSLENYIPFRLGMDHSDPYFFLCRVHIHTYNTLPQSYLCPLFVGWSENVMLVKHLQILCLISRDCRMLLLATSSQCGLFCGLRPSVFQLYR